MINPQRTKAKKQTNKQKMGTQYRHHIYHTTIMLFTAAHETSGADYGKGYYISGTHFKQLTNQNRLGFLESRALKSQKLFQGECEKRYCSNVKYNKNKSL